MKHSSSAFERAVDYEIRGAQRDQERFLWREEQLMRDGWAALGRRPDKAWEEDLDKRLPPLKR